MFWLTVFTIIVAILRLLLVIAALWCTIQRVCDRFQLSCCTRENRRKIFLFANITYLLGLLPHSLLLFPIFSSELTPISVQSGCGLTQAAQESTVCWTQRLSCVISLEIQMLLCLTCLAETLMETVHSTVFYNLQKKAVIFLTATACTLIILWQGFYLWPNEEDLRWKYFNIQTDNSLSRDGCDYNIIMRSPSPVDSAKQVIQIQLLLCEERLTSNRVKSYLLFSAICGIPTSVFILVMKRRHKLLSSENKEEKTVLWAPDRRYQCLCTKDDPVYDDASSFLSLVITLWILIMRPLVVAFSSLYSDNFVDYGTHVLLTICIILPITFTHSHKHVDNNLYLPLKRDFELNVEPDVTK